MATKDAAAKAQNDTDKPARHTKQSAVDKLAQVRADVATDAATAGQRARDDEAEIRAQRILDVRDRAAKLGWKIFPDEKPVENATVLVATDGSSPGPSVFQAEYRKDGPNGPDGSFYGNLSGSYSVFAPGVQYWRETIEAPPPMPRGA